MKIKCKDIIKITDVNAKTPRPHIQIIQSRGWNKNGFLILVQHVLKGIQKN
jgi:hypothetical protein